MSEAGKSSSGGRWGRVFFIGVLIVVIAVAVIGYVHRYREAVARMTPAAQEAAPVGVRTAPLMEEAIEECVYATGTIRAVSREYCYFQTSGKVVWVKQVDDPAERGGKRDIREGDTVQKGELLAQLDPRDLEQELKVQQASLAEAEAELKKARADFHRYKTLYERKATSQTEYERYSLGAARAEAALTTARARVRQAEIAVEHARIVAPCDGICAYVNVRKGYHFDHSAHAESESEMLKNIPFVILHDETMEMVADIPATYAGEVKVGQDAYLLKDLGAGRLGEAPPAGAAHRILPAKVYSVNPAVDPGGRSVRVKLRTTVADNLFRDGQYVSCVIVTRRAEQALALSYNVLLFEDNQPYCFVMKGDRAERRNLKLGIEGENKVQVVSGLTVGEKVIGEGNHRLVTGTLVSEATEPPESVTKPSAKGRP